MKSPFTVIAKLDGIEIKPCRVGGGKYDMAGVVEPRYHGPLTGRIFKHGCGDLYFACEAHLYHYLNHLAKDGTGGWEEVNLEDII